MKRWLRNIGWALFIAASLSVAAFLGLNEGHQRYLASQQKASYKIDLLYLRTCVLTADDRVMHIVHKLKAEDLSYLKLILPLCDIMLDTTPRPWLTDDQDFNLGQARLFLDGFTDLATEIVLEEINLELLYLEEPLGLDPEDPGAKKILDGERKQRERVEELAKFRQRFMVELQGAF